MEIGTEPDIASSAKGETPIRNILESLRKTGERYQV
jgi:hypothetical protein